MKCVVLLIVLLLFYYYIIIIYPIPNYTTQHINKSNPSRIIKLKINFSV
jgi:hypothetical protein